MMFDYGDHMSGVGWAFMSVSMVLFWGLLVTGIVLLVRYLGTSSRDSTAPRPSAAELLAERFARGEIDEQEYRARLDALRDVAASPWPR